jgi:beta-glucanase (GH16 family)
MSGKVMSPTVPCRRPNSNGGARRDVRRPVEGLETRVLLTGDGLLGTYFDNPALTGAAVTRVDPAVDFAWAARRSPAERIAPFSYSVRWTGQVQPRYSETYTFSTVSDDGVRLWVDGRKLIDHWTRHAPAVNAGRITLEAGRRYDIRMEYCQHYGSAVAKLRWSSASQAAEVIPQSQLYSAATADTAAVAATGTGLTAQYFDNADFTGASVTRVDPAVAFDWGANSPAPGISPGTYSIRWSGKLQPRYSEPYTFFTTADDGVRLWVNGQLVVDRWSDRPPLAGDANGDGVVNFADYQILERQIGTANPQTDFNQDGTVNFADFQVLYNNLGKTLAATAPTDSGTINLQADQAYDVRLEYYQGSDQAQAKLEWQSPSQAREVVPTSQLYPSLPEPPPTDPPPIAGSWQMKFRDEFDGARVDPVWHPAQWWDRDSTIVGGGELQAYDASAVSVSNGMLHLTARKEEKYAGTPYVSGLVMTGGYRYDASIPRFSFLHGYMEVRAKLPAGQGLWPAIWMMPASYNDGNGELDVLEALMGDPTRAYFTVHRNGRQEGHEWVGPDFSTDYHIFGVDWEADHISWYVDGVERARTTNTALICPEAMYPILNLAVGGDWGGPPDATTVFPSSMDVDYIRIWQKA